MESSSVPDEGYLVSAPVSYVPSTPGAKVSYKECVINEFVTKEPGDLLLRQKGNANILARLPVGEEGQVLTIKTGMPTWSDIVNYPKKEQKCQVTVYVSGTPDAVQPGLWVQVGKHNGLTTAVWDDNRPGACNIEGAFNIYDGTFLAPRFGYYRLSGCIAFTGNASGSGVIPYRTCIRQVRVVLHRRGELHTLVHFESQPPPYSGNPTQICIPGFIARLEAGDKVTLEVRHDAAMPLRFHTGDIRQPPPITPDGEPSETAITALAATMSQLSSSRDVVTTLFSAEEC